MHHTPFTVRRSETTFVRNRITTNPGFSEGARGQDPFSAFIEHQEKLVVLMATGGTLTSLAQADTGALAGGAQMDVWEQIVKRDAAIIGDALDRCLFRTALEAAFPGKAAAAHFELGRDDEPDAGELFDLAAKARTAGYRVERTELEEASGYTLVEDAPAQPGGFGGFGNAQTPLQLHAKALQNASRGAGATSVPPEAETRLEAILDDFAEKLGEEMLGEMALKSAGALRGGGGDEGEGEGEGAVKNSTDAKTDDWTPLTDDEAVAEFKRITGLEGDWRVDHGEDENV